MGRYPAPRLGLVVAVGVACLAASPADAANVRVTVDNVQSARGEIHVDICDQATFLGTNCPFDAFAPAKRGRVIVTVHNVPPGRYAAVAYHDENANRDLDLNALGMPKEPYGFSNDPPLLLGPPLFKDSAFDVRDKDIDVKIRLKR